MTFGLSLSVLVAQMPGARVSQPADSSAILQFDASWKWDHVANHVELTLVLRHLNDNSLPMSILDIDVALIWEGGSDTVTIVQSSDEETFYIPAERAPYRVELDPNGKIVMALIFEKGQREIVRQLNDGGPVARSRAARWLGGAEANTVSEALGLALQNDPYRLVRQYSAASLGTMRTKSARDHLLSTISIGDAYIRESVATALGHYLGDLVVASALERQFVADSSDIVRAAIVLSMARLKVKGSFQFAVAALDSNSHEEVVRKRALEALAILGDPQGIDLAKMWAANDRPPRIRWSAIEVLPALTKNAPFRRREVKQYLFSLVDDDDPWSRDALYRALGEMGGNQAVLLLENARANEPDDLARQSAHDALQAIISKYN